MTTSTFQILLALADGERHGLGIIETVEHHTEGATVMPIGTLYRSLKALVDEGLIAPCAPRRLDEDPRRRHYRNTPAGLAALRSEARRAAKLVDWARSLKLLGRSVS